MVLIDKDTNVNQEEWHLTAAQAGQASDPAWSIRKYRLHGGRQEGVEVIDVDNGVLKLRIVPTRGMGIWSATAGDVQLKWDSPVKEIVHPHYVNLEARGGLGWLEGFGEFMCRCGMEFNGAPGEDTIINNFGQETKTMLTLHGKAAYLPATHVRVVVDPDPPHTIRVFGTVEETMMFGPKLVLETQISTVPGSKEFTIKDKITNRAGTKSEMQMLYHSNYGSPLLAEGSRFVGPVTEVAPRDARAAEGGVENYADCSGPRENYAEQVYFVKVKGDDDGQTLVMLRNQDAGRSATIRYNVAELPYLTIWKNTTTERDGYATGIEPGTNYPNNRSVERAKGRLPVLGPGESRVFTLTYGVQTTPDEVAAALAEIHRIQGDSQPVIKQEPE